MRCLSISFFKFGDLPTTENLQIRNRVPLAVCRGITNGSRFFTYSWDWGVAVGFDGTTTTLGVTAATGGGGGVRKKNHQTAAAPSSTSFFFLGRALEGACSGSAGSVASGTAGADASSFSLRKGASSRSRSTLRRPGSCTSSVSSLARSSLSAVLSVICYSWAAQRLQKTQLQIPAVFLLRRTSRSAGIKEGDIKGFSQRAACVQ